MSDDVLSAARQRREDLRARIERLVAELASSRSELARLDDFVRTWNMLSGVAEEAGPSAVDVGAVGSGRNPKRDELLPLLSAIIRAEGRPVDRVRLLELLRDRHGVTIYGKDPRVVLSTMLWRNQDKFVHLPKRGYWDLRFGDPPPP